MAKAIIRFGYKGGKHTSQILQLKQAIQLMQNTDFVHGQNPLPHLCKISRSQPRMSLECPNGFWAEIEYIPSKPRVQ